MPKISIVIPTYNQAHLLRLALESVRVQSVTDWEAIIVNNHSDDDTAAVVDSFAEPRFRRIDFRNHGIIAASRNLGIRKSAAEWVAFLDSDDLWTDDKLARCLAAATDGVDAVSHREAVVENGIPRGVTELGDARRVRVRSLLFDGNCLSPSAILVRRPMLERMGGFAEDPELVTAEDFDLWLRMARAGTRFAFVDAVLGQYTLHAANSSGSVTRHMDAGIRVLDRHFAALYPRIPGDRLRHRRAVARVVYAAGRSCQRMGRRAEALRFFARSARMFPFQWKPYAAALMALAGTGGPVHGVKHPA